MSKKTKKALLLGPPNPFLENPHSVPRLGLLYLGTILQKAGHSVLVRHLNSLREMERISATDFDFIGISATTREYPDAVQILNYLKREKHPATIAIGGPHATALPEECRQNGFDLVVAGEADEAIEQLLYRKPKAPEIIDCGFAGNLDAIPFPERTLMEENWDPFMFLGQDREIQVASIMLSRGCPYACTFCGPHYPYRRRSDANIAAELKSIHEQAYSGLVILDDLPFVTKEQAAGFCDFIRPFRMRFRCNFRPNLMTPQAAKLLAEAGCCRIQLGIESATQDILSTIKRGVRTDTNGKAITICHDHGIQVKAMFIWGLPGDGPETAEAIIAWVERYRPDSVQISAFVPLPGSPLWNSCFHHNVVDYRALSFFADRQNPSAITGVGNNLLSAEELRTLRQDIFEKCAQFTHIDLGLPPMNRIMNFYKPLEVQEQSDRISHGVNSDEARNELQFSNA
ncbi:MAG: B12-binding domain-containing radical SAM protein [Gammaproteobacteria bacterium]|nr:B12-binding domain-containing radical SAM protein [Gammaproteobacteria bacterium]